MVILVAIFLKAKGESGLQEGQMLLFTMPDVDGHVALFLSEIQLPSDDPNYNGQVSKND